MIRGLWEVFLALLADGEEADPDEESADGSRFVPSPLDLSVRVGHGGRDDEVVRELSKIGERAEEIEENQRRRDR
jgi:hypothetical protein